ncbi:MAG TPA: glutamine--fructose-6-phosphate transaminase (isomerizing) [Nitrososphaeraceae archaeon]
MCSIIGYKGNQYAAPVLIDSLKKMEYRGYDSVGISTIDDGTMLVRKGVGKVAEVNKHLQLNGMPGKTGIGHTRWATHGRVNDVNAHPHTDCSGSIAVVHNGIIENYEVLKKELIQKGHSFKSDTDSEVIAHLIEEHHSSNQNVKSAMIETCKRLKGTFAFVSVFENGALSGARFDEPLIIGVDKNGCFISSDVLGFLKYTDKAIFLDNRDIVIADKSGIQLFDFDGNIVRRHPTQIAWELAAVDKGRYAHHTLKEIHEQGKIIAEFNNRDKGRLTQFCNILSKSQSVYITGSGSSYHAALIGKYLLAKYPKIRAECVMSSEFQYVQDLIDDHTAVIAISQSGESADVLQAVKAAKQRGAIILSIINITTSSLARISDCFLEIGCGPEIGVAATKSFTSQLSVLYGIVNNISNENRFQNDLGDLAKAIEATISIESEIEKISEKIKDFKDIYIMGRSLHYPIALEGALKIKELSYIHAEGIAGGELKHGPLAVVDRNTLVFVINPSDSTYSDIISNAHEIKTRGATVIGISDLRNSLYDDLIKIPAVEEILYPLIEVIPFQLLAYYLALMSNADPDYPRNLAKSVTVK